MLQLAGVLTDHAVLQRQMPIPIWGMATPGAIIRVELSSGAVAVGRAAGDSGRFLVRLTAQEAGGPFELRVSAGADQVTLDDIWIGEVWLAGGQSNMEMPLRGYQTPIPGVEEIAFGAPVRMLTVPQRAVLAPAGEIAGRWTLPTPEDLPGWSAVGAFFAARLSRELQVPVGVIASNWGGTIAEAWCSRGALLRNEDYADAMLRYEAVTSTPAYWTSVRELGLLDVASISVDDMTAKSFEAHMPEYPANLGVGRNWAAVAFDDSAWGEVELPGIWQIQTDFRNSGAVWFRRRVALPAAWRGRALTLEIGAADKHDVTYCNGVEVGHTGSGVETAHWNVGRSYPVPAALVTGDTVVIAVRVYSFMFGGGLIGPADAMKLYPVGAPEEAIGLDGVWRWQVELDLGQTRSLTMGTGNPNSFAILYDNMIRPLLPYAVRGAIWYQGESNGEAPHFYRELMNTLIEDWRNSWGQREFAFHQVLLAGFADPCTATWPLIREAQRLAAEDTASGYASAIDIGDPTDIHPLDKRTVGERLALRALADQYGCPVEGQGPVAIGCHWSAAAVTVHFSHADGLTARGGEPRGWEVAGADGVWVAARAVIDGTQVVVSAAGVTPGKVRYAWSGYPVEANLYNAAGLPMIPLCWDLSESKGAELPA